MEEPKSQNGSQNGYPDNICISIAPCVCTCHLDRMSLHTSCSTPQRPKNRMSNNRKGAGLKFSIGIDFFKPGLKILIEDWFCRARGLEIGFFGRLGLKKMRERSGLIFFGRRALRVNQECRPGGPANPTNVSIWAAKRISKNDFSSTRSSAPLLQPIH